jgi:hypothetical protein
MLSIFGAFEYNFKKDIVIFLNNFNIYQKLIFEN